MLLSEVIPKRVFIPTSSYLFFIPNALVSRTKSERRFLISLKVYRRSLRLRLKLQSQESWPFIMLNGRGHLILSQARSSEDSKSSRSITGHPPKLPIHLATVCECHLTSSHSHSISLIFDCLTYHIASIPPCNSRNVHSTTSHHILPLSTLPSPPGQAASSQAAERLLEAFERRQFLLMIAV